MEQVLPELILLALGAALRVEGGNREAGVHREFEGFDRELVHLPEHCIFGGGSCHPCQALVGVEREIEQGPILVTLDLVSIEEYVCFKVVDCLITVSVEIEYLREKRKKEKKKKERKG